MISNMTSDAENDTMMIAFMNLMSANRVLENEEFMDLYIPDDNFTFHNHSDLECIKHLAEYLQANDSIGIALDVIVGNSTAKAASLHESLYRYLQAWKLLNAGNFTSKYFRTFGCTFKAFCLSMTLPVPF